jgi:hypothetical protein
MAKICKYQKEEHKKILETTDKGCTTISLVLLQNHEFKY